MSTIRIALLQMTSTGDEKANLAKGEDFCRKAAGLGADIALFPEMWNMGYAVPKPFSRKKLNALATPIDGPFVTHFRELARELRMAIAITYLQKWDRAPRNVVSLIDRTGKITLTYAKVHTCDFGPLERSCTPGEDFHVATLKTGSGNVRIGTMICYDREFPESARMLMLKGAEIILTPNACTLEPARLAQFRTRAFENMLGVAMTNYAAPQHNGRSCAYDGVQSDVKGGAVDPLLVDAGPGEGVYVAAFDLDRLRAYRAKGIWGDAFRRPHRYGLLTSPSRKKPFIRRDAFKKPYNPRKR